MTSFGEFLPENERLVKNNYRAIDRYHHCKGIVKFLKVKKIVFSMSRVKLTLIKKFPNPTMVISIDYPIDSQGKA